MTADGAGGRTGGGRTGGTIGVRDVSWAAGGRLRVDGVTFVARPGRVVGLVGPNGSGKSSLLRLIAGLRPVGSGVVTLDGDGLASLPRNAIARRLAFVDQQVETEAPLTVSDVVRLGRTPHRGPLSAWTDADGTAVAQALAWVDLSDRRDQPWHTLSGGERQRVQIARALAQTPTELLLDEPTNHLDVRHQLDVLSLLRHLPATTVVALHDLNLAAMFCDDLAVLKDGRLVAAGPPGEVLTADLIRDVFAVDAQVQPDPDGGPVHVRFRPRVRAAPAGAGTAA